MLPFVFLLPSLSLTTLSTTPFPWAGVRRRKKIKEVKCKGLRVNNVDAYDRLRVLKTALGWEP
jgi:hypothetical protein